MAEKDVKYVKKKRVTIHCARPFRIGYANYSGVIRNVVVDVGIIATCIGRKALVNEILSNGKEVPLSFDNYNKYNGPTDVTDNDKNFFENDAHKMPIINAKGEVIKENANPDFKQTKTNVKIGTKKESKEEDTDSKTVFENTVKTETVTKKEVEKTIKQDVQATVNVVESSNTSVLSSDNSNNKKELDYKSSYTDKETKDNKKKNKW